MSSAGRGHDGEPASPDSAPASKGGQAATDGQATTATAVVTPSTDSPGSTSGTTSMTKAQPEPVAQLSRVRAIWRIFRLATARTWVRHVALLLIYIGAGIAATWPRVTYLFEGKLPRTSDNASFVWGMWWVANHLIDPFFTRYMAAPGGIQLGFSTLMPLPGYVMMPVTRIAGPSAAFTVLSLIVPGLLCYTMFRAARLWLNVPGSIAAGAFFGLSSMMLWQNWYHINIAAGLIFLPMTIEAAVRLRRTQKIAPAVWLGVALGAAVMTSQEGAAIALLIAVVIMVPWIIGKLIRDRASLQRALVPLGLGAVVAFFIASPQLVAMVQQIASGGAKVPVGTLALNYTQFGVPLQTMFSPSPRLAYYGLGHLSSAYAYDAAVAFGTSVQPQEGMPTFGVVASGLALIGVLIGCRKRATWWFLLLWVASAALALGTSLVIGSSCVFNQIQPGKLFGRSCHQYLPLANHIHYTLVKRLAAGWQPVHVSNLMPYTWLVRIPGLAGLREADRFMLVGMIAVALLAGLVVDWLSRRRRWIAIPLITSVAGLGVLESGWAGGTVGSLSMFTPTETMRTAMPAFDALLRADHSNLIVVDAPFGLRGGLRLTGASISDRTFLLATEDGHPRAASYTAWVPLPTVNAIEAHAFYNYLMVYQSATTYPTRPQLAAAAADLKTLHVGWVIEWDNEWRGHEPKERLYKLQAYLRELGFRRVAVTCLVPSKPGTLCGGRPLEKVRLLKYVPKDAYTSATPIRRTGNGGVARP